MTSSQMGFFPATSPLVYCVPTFKAAGGHILDVEACLVLKISWPPEDKVLPPQWFDIVHDEDGVVLGTPACHALGIIDDQ